MKLSWIFTWVFGGIGVLLVVAAILVFLSEQKFMNAAKVTEGKVIRLNYESSSNGGAYYPVVEFRDKGNTFIFKSSIGSDPASYAEGDSVEVLYDIAEMRFQIKGFEGQWLIVAVVGGFGFIFFVIGAIIGYFTYKRKQLEGWLKNYGQRIETDFDYVGVNLKLKVNNRSPNLIHCKWVDKLTNITYEFKSDNIWFDPTPFVQNRKIPVLIDPSDPKKYVMDISFLPKEGN